MGLDYERDWDMSAGIFQFAAKHLDDLPPGEQYARPIAELRREARIAAFDAYLKDTYEVTGRPLPESQNTAGLPDVRAIIAEHPVSFGDLLLDTPFKRRLEAAAERVGFAVRLKPVAPRVTYGALLAFAREQRMSEKAGTATCAQSGSNVVHACRRLMVHLRRSDDDCCDTDLVNHLDVLIEEIARAVANPKTARKLRAELSSLADYHRRLLAGVGLPASFPEAVKELCRRRGVTLPYLERRLGVNNGLINKWTVGQGLPCRASLGVVAAMEQFFGIAPCALSGLLPKRLRTGPGKAGGRPSLSERYGSKVVRHLPPDIDQRTEEEREAIVADVRKTLVAQNTPYATKLAELCADEYVLASSDWPAEARDEWACLLGFKMADIPPPGTLRAPRAVWNDVSAVMNMNRTAQFYGFASLPIDRGGLGLPRDAMGLWLFTFSSIPDAYVRWCKQRRGGVVNMEDENFTAMAASFVRFRFGPVYQTPRLADRLEKHASAITAVLLRLERAVVPPRHLAGEMEGLIAASVADAHAEWLTRCAATEVSLRELAEHLAGVTQQTRDPFAPIKGLLDQAAPMTEYWKLIRSMDEACPDPRTSPFPHHWHMRDRVVARLLWMLRFRSKNMRCMTWKDDGTGHLRKVDGRYEVHVPWRDFKANGPFFGPRGRKRDFKKVLADKDGTYALLDEYIGASRPFLLQGHDHDILLVSSTGEGFVSAESFGHMYTVITGRYFAHNPHLGTGLPGVMPHGPHAIRHVVVNHILKRHGRLDVAAAAIQDSEAEVSKTYGRWLPEDKDRLVEDHLASEAFVEGLASKAVDAGYLARLEAEVLQLRARLAGSG
jgi:hypothetical protein